MEMYHFSAGGSTTGQLRLSPQEKHFTQVVSGACEQHVARTSAPTSASEMMGLHNIIYYSLFFLINRDLENGKRVNDSNNSKAVPTIQCYVNATVKKMQMR